MMTKSLNLIERATWMGALFVLFAFCAQFAAAAEPMLYTADGTACVVLHSPGPSAAAGDEESIIVQRPSTDQELMFIPACSW